MPRYKSCPKPTKLRGFSRVGAVARGKPDPSFSRKCVRRAHPSCEISVTMVLSGSTTGLHLRSIGPGGLGAVARPGLESHQSNIYEA